MASTAPWARLTAYMVGLKDPKVIGSWALLKSKPQTDISDARLRAAYRIVRTFVGAADARTAKSWLLGTNTRLDDEAPAALIRNADNPEVLVKVVRAARAYFGVWTGSAESPSILT